MKGDLHTAGAALEVNEKFAAFFIDQEERSGGPVVGFSSAEPQFLPQAVFSGHYLFALHFQTRLGGGLDGLNAVAAVETAGLLVEDIFAPCEVFFGVGGRIFSHAADRAGPMPLALSDQGLDEAAFELIEDGMGEETELVCFDSDVRAFEPGVAEFGELRADGLTGHVGLFGGLLFDG